VNLLLVPTGHRFLTIEMTILGVIAVGMALVALSMTQKRLVRSAVRRASVFAVIGACSVYPLGLLAAHERAPHLAAVPTISFSDLQAQVGSHRTEAVYLDTEDSGDGASGDETAVVQVAGRWEKATVPSGFANAFSLTVLKDKVRTLDTVPGAVQARLDGATPGRWASLMWAVGLLSIAGAGWCLQVARKEERPRTVLDRKFDELLAASGLRSDSRH
jgi:hypothetical protein